MSYYFEEYELDVEQCELRRAGLRVTLRRKVFDVLAYLVEHRARAVSKEELLQQLWSGRVVSPSTIDACMMEVRLAVGDSGQTQRLIRTLRGRGYRFIADVDAQRAPDSAQAASQCEGCAESGALFVGRALEVATLEQWYEKACRGQLQVGFIHGEAGIGKTALVDAFVDRARANDDLWVGHGQCIEHYGAGEPYLPLLEALGRLCRGPEGASFLALLQRHAPSWVAQMPALLPPEEREGLWNQDRQDAQGRMLRELTEAIAILTAERPFLLVLEDAHWSDGATLEWLAYMARCREPARFLMLVTYRPIETIVHAHSLRSVVAELQPHWHCHDLALDYLSEAAVASYLNQRFVGASLPGDFVHALRQRTNGNPLFLTAVMNDLLQRHVLVEHASSWRLTETLDALTQRVPADLRLFIEHHVEALPPDDQAILEAASVSGHSFSVAEVEAALDIPAPVIELTCMGWSRQGRFVQADGAQSWPDGTVAARFRFVHGLYHHVCYEHISAGLRIDWHQRIGRRKEAGYEEEAGVIAPELAMHFERGNDPSRAVSYWRQAGQMALRRSSYREAIAYLRRGLELLAATPETMSRDEQEFDLQRPLGACLAATKGHNAPETLSVYQRLMALGRQLNAITALPEGQ